jgi:hypothetical protein
MPNFHNIEADIENDLNDIIEKLAFPEGIKFKILGVEKQKTLFKLVKVPDIYSYLMKAYFILLVNQELYDKLSGDSEKAIEILADEELCKAAFDLEKGKTTTVKPDSVGFKANYNKYGFDKVQRAKDLERTSIKQAEDDTEDSKEAVVISGNKSNPFFQD